MSRAVFGFGRRLTRVDGVVSVEGAFQLKSLVRAIRGTLAELMGPAGLAVDRLSRRIRFLAVTGRGGGANAWVAAASRPATGRPILANDPHLPAVVPPQFYLAHLRCPTWHAAGASLVGLPGIFCGHTDTAAWASPRHWSTNTDLRVEEVGADRRSVRREDVFVTCERSDLAREKSECNIRSQLKWMRSK